MDPKGWGAGLVVSGLVIACNSRGGEVRTEASATPSKVAPAPSATAPGAAAPSAAAPMTAAPGASARRPDYAVSIPGVLTIRAPDRDNRSHGIGDEPWRAWFLVTNETAQPLTLSVSELVLHSDEAGLAPANQAQALHVTRA